MFCRVVFCHESRRKRKEKQERKKKEKEKKEKMQSSKQLQKVLIAASINFLVALYLVKEHFSEEPSFCDVSSIISCSTINKSSFSSLFGIPVSILGVFWSGLMVASSIYLSTIAPLASKKDVAIDVMFCMYLWTLMGGVFIVYLFFAELIVGAICPLCTIVHITALYMLLTCRTMFWENKHPSTTLTHALSNLWERRQKEFAAVGLVFCTLVLVFVLSTNPFGFPSPFSHFHSSSPSSSSSKGSNDKPPDSPAMVLLPLKEHLKYAACFMRTPNGLHFYGQDGCSHCTQQKNELGDLLSAVVYHECGRECQEENQISGTPTWIYEDSTGKKTQKMGFLSLEKLYSFAGCEETGW